MSQREANDTVVDTVRPGARCGARNASAAAASARERVGHGAMERFAGARQRERAMVSLEQRHAERVLEGLDLPRQRRLRQEELFGGEREGQPPSGRLEAAEEVERRQACAASSASVTHSLDACKTCERTV